MKGMVISLSSSSSSSSSSPLKSTTASWSLSLAAPINRMSISLVPYVLTIVVILLCCTPVQSRWCTRLVTYTTVKPYVLSTTCNQSYEESCGFFTFSQCVRYEEVPCMVERNKTVLMYKIVESCCPGYKLNPVNNVTCIRMDSDGEEGHDGRVEYYDSHGDGKLFGLTNGAYAGIASCLVLLLCVLILVAVRIHKRRRSAKLKAEAQAVEMEASQTMIPNSTKEAQA